MHETKVLLLKYGEIALKGLNRHSFEKQLEKNIIAAIKGYKAANGEERYFSIEREQSTMTIECRDEHFDMEKIVPALSKVFGIAAINLALKTQKDINEIKEAAKKHISPMLKGKGSFGVFAKRSDKSFPLKSPEISAIVGNALFSESGGINVDLKNPEVWVGVEIRSNGAFIHASNAKYRGAGGMPAGSSGSGLLLLSGGIDSPVAGYMMARRGMRITALHFTSEPYTSARAKEKAIRLSEILAEYCGPVKFCSANLSEMQENIKKCCDADYATILLRRFMVKIAESAAKSEACDCLVTGEALGQVASQTIEAIKAIYDGVRIPVLRPCIGLDKAQIIEIAEKIGTYETSVEPYEDCCSIFAPRHPVTKPKLEKVQKEEARIADAEGLFERALAQAQK
ncbi:MAG: tRNA 4-thiouridine(8) synthase ThiI [Oscillospiraceae bacterium]|nr:tRNA 4-thiouridine(8) synthase ThiI [Oscillospiraceae bacterium]